MSRSAALVRARSLREALLDHGVPKVSIEIQQGRPGTPNGRWYDDRFVGSMGHHIVSRRSQGLTPGLSLIKRGRSDVPGPLCNGYGGFDRTARIICMGWANHPGVGGPYTLPSGRIPANNGRPYLFGWEHEGGLNLADWTDEFRSFMGSCHAGTLDWLGLRDTSHIEHKTWTSRKIDRLNYTLASARAEIRDNWDGDDMNADEKQMLKDIHRQVGSPIESVDGQDWRLSYTLQRLWHRLFNQVAPVTSVDGNTWSPSYTTQRLWHRLYDLPALVRTLAEAQDEGLDLDAMLARLDQHAEAASEERQAILTALDGADPAEAKLAAILEILGVDA